jgi:hypothetical protein
LRELHFTGSGRGKKVRRERDGKRKEENRKGIKKKMKENVEKEKLRRERGRSQDEESVARR